MVEVRKLEKEKEIKIVEKDCKGIVKWFNIRRGLGFIAREDDKEFFVHHKGILGKGFRILYKDEKVEFDLRESGEENKGPVAINVKVIKSDVR